MSIPEWISAFSDANSALIAALTFLGLESPVRRRASCLPTISVSDMLPIRSDAHNPNWTRIDNWVQVFDIKHHGGNCKQTGPENRPLHYNGSLKGVSTEEMEEQRELRRPNLVKTGQKQADLEHPDLAKVLARPVGHLDSRTIGCLARLACLHALFETFEIQDLLSKTASFYVCDNVDDICQRHVNLHDWPMGWDN
ncbi:hypothetical protein V8C35DRAFT_280585 [Trichoderma chlorosporum]